MKVYLDTCIVSGLIKEDLGEDEFVTLDRILEAWQAHQVDLCTSKVTSEELSKVPDRYRREHDPDLQANTTRANCTRGQNGQRPIAYGRWRREENRYPIHESEATS